MTNKTDNVNVLVETYLVTQIGTRVQRQKGFLRRFARFCNRYSIHIDAVTVKDMEMFIEELKWGGLTPGYIAGQFALIRKFFDFLSEKGIVRGNPARNVFARAEKREPRLRSDNRLKAEHRLFHPRA